MKLTTIKRRAALTALFCLANACGTGTMSGATGSVAVKVWGEEYIPVGIPAAMGEEAGFENGWSLRYTKFLIVLGDESVATTDTATPVTNAGLRVYNLVPVVEPLAITTLVNVSATRHAAVGYRMAPATRDTAAGNAETADVTLMQSNGYSIYFEATATHATRGMYTLRWGFNNTVRFADCHGEDDLPGLVVPTNGTANFQITIHADHPWYDDLQSETAKIRFDAYADADANMDRTITLEELAAVDLTRLPTGQYGTGSARNVNTLRDFVGSLVNTVGHFNGEGHCQERPGM